MKRHSITLRAGLVALMLGSVALLIGCDDDDDGCEANITEQCTCDDGASGARACKADGSGFDPCVCQGGGDADADADADIECPAVTVNVNIPDDYPGDALRIGAWFYAADMWPPEGPPQGGWDVYQKPDLTAGEPYELVVHTINLSRDACLMGDHVMTVSITMSEPEVGRRANPGKDYTGESDPITLTEEDVTGGDVDMRILTCLDTGDLDLCDGGV
jgi:hypothetical protein